MALLSKWLAGRLTAYQRELMDTHYREVENMYRKMRGWRHDYRNHIQALKALCAAGDTDGMRAYLDDLENDLKYVDTVVKTGNAMADAILNSKISLAQSHKINVVVSAHIPIKLEISDVDLCIIVGNLFDNAIEASLALPEAQRVIRVYIDIKGAQLYISFTNFTSTRKLARVGRLFKSARGEGHGFGLIRIDSIVDKLNGYVRRESEDGAFTTEILLPIR